jgi:hypothetical protein
VLELYSENAWLDSTDRQRLSDMISSNFMSLFKIGNVKPGNIQATDARTGVEYSLREYGMANAIKRDQVIMLRICLEDDRWIIIAPDSSLSAITPDDSILKLMIEQLPKTITIKDTDAYNRLRIKHGIIAGDSESTPKERKLSNTEAKDNNDGDGQSTRLTPAKFPRNEPCPCGSGKKYKKCHG